MIKAAIRFMIDLGRGAETQGADGLHNALRPSGDALRDEGVGATHEVDRTYAFAFKLW